MVTAARTSTLALLLLLACPQLIRSCDVDLDLCPADPITTAAATTAGTAGETTTAAPEESSGAVGVRPLLLLAALAMGRGSGDFAVSPMLLLPLAGLLPSVMGQDTCGDLKSFYKSETCCGSPTKALSTPFCNAPTGVCACERMKTALAGVPGAMFPADFCNDFAHIKPVGHRSAPICEANDAGSDASLLEDGKAGDQNYPHGMIKVLATVGEVNPKTGAMLTGVPDGQGAYLLNDNVVRFVYQSESYGPLHRQETFPFFVNGDDHVGVTGSHIHFIDYDRAKLAAFMDSGAPASAESMVVDSGEAVSKMYNLKKELVGKRNATGPSAKPHHSNVNINGDYIVAATPNKADWLMQSLCSASLSPKSQWGAGIGVEDNLYVTNEEWISYKSDSSGLVGLPAHVLNLATGDLYATSAFGMGGFEKIVEVNTKTTGFVAFVPSGYNGAFGGDFPAVVAARNAKYSRTDGQPYVWPQNIVPTRLYVGKKNTNKDGASDTTDFMARNGFEYGAIYGFATDCSANTPGAEGRDAWHKNTASPGDKVVGKFFKLKWQNQPGVVSDFVDDQAWEYQDAPQGAPAGWCWWNQNGKDNSGSKTEHVSPDPNGGLRVLQSSTAGYFGIYDFSDLETKLASGNFPDSIEATYTCLQPEKDVTGLIELGGAGKLASPAGSGIDAKKMCDKDDGTTCKDTFEDIDAIDWFAGSGGEDWIAIHEDGGNRYGERFLMAKVGTPMKYYFVAQSGGKLSSRSKQGVSAVAGTFKSATSHEFSGSTDLSGMLAKNADGSFKVSANDATGARRTTDASVAINEKVFSVSLQAHTNWGGWTESFHPDAAGQVLIYKPAITA